jgi:hypothetical protein
MIGALVELGEYWLAFVISTMCGFALLALLRSLAEWWDNLIGWIKKILKMAGRG